MFSLVSKIRFSLSLKIGKAKAGIVRSMSTQPESLDIFVQVLPVIQTPSTDGIRLSKSSSKILLCKWNTGHFKDRYTGLIKSLSRSQSDLIHSTKISSKKHGILFQEAKNMLPPKIQEVTNEVELVARLRFQDPPACDEYIYIAKLEGRRNDGESVLNFNEVIKFDEHQHPCHWFNWDRIPFDEMPADDEVWYGEVLWRQGKLTGSFSFGGWDEKKIKSYELKLVDQVE